MTAMTLPIENGHGHGIGKIHWNVEVIEKLRSIPGNEPIALFTPIVPHYRGPAQQGQECPADMDPFECFGRALSEYHRRIAHVPYDPREGFTAEHYSWAHKASGIIVVNVEPWGNDFHACKTSYLEQQDFAATTADVVEHAGESGQEMPPVALVKCGVDWETDVDPRNVAIMCPDYSAGSLQVAAHFLFYGS